MWKLFADALLLLLLLLLLYLISILLWFV